MAVTVEPNYEEQFTAFVDFLGFGEISAKTDEATRLKVLDLLLSLSALRGEFDLQSTTEGNSKRISIKPAISTFSDHIVISYSLQPIYSEMGSDERPGTNIILFQFVQLLARIAAAALRIGFLVRGGATIGKLYHARGVVFGEALVDAFHIESRTAIYPRVVLSPKITGRPMWMQSTRDIVRGYDGLYHFDYFSFLLFTAVNPGDKYADNLKAWYDDVVEIVTRNLSEHESNGRLNELAKWAWFAREFRSGLERLPSEILKSYGLSLDAITWPK
jgi:hypothetical protein